MINLQKPSDYNVEDQAILQTSCCLGISEPRKVECLSISELQVVAVIVLHSKSQSGLIKPSSFVVSTYLK